jgi:hypothetical protein
VIIEGAQEGLIDDPADEVVDGGIAGEHVGERIGLALDPEVVLTLHVLAIR